MATDLERWPGYVLLQSSAMPGIPPPCRVYFSFSLTGRVPFVLFQWKRLSGKLSFPDSMLSSPLPLTPAKLDGLDTFPRYTPTFKALYRWHGLIHVSLQLLRVQWHKLSLTPRRVGILAGLRFCTAQKAGCVPPGAAGQSQVDVSVWGMSQHQS